PYTLTVLGAPPEPGKELEPNNRAVDATALQPGQPMQGTYLAGEDEDWYRLEAPKAAPGDFLRIEVTPVAGVRPELEVRALADGALLASMHAGPGEGLFVRNLSLHLGERTSTSTSTTSGTNPSTSTSTPSDAGIADAPEDAGTFQPPPPAGYYLVLKSHKGAPLVPYTLKASLEAGPPDLEQEPNDDAQHATPVQGATATGYLAPAGDQDWYRVHADAPSVLRAEVTGVARADLELSVYGAPDKLLTRVNEGGPKEGEIAPSVGVPAGDSFVVVQAAPRNLDGKWVRDGEDRENPYKLSIALSPDDGSTDREPNNDLASAQTVTVPASIRGWIWPRKDVDFYRFHIGPGHAPVSITLSAVRGVDLHLRLYQLHGANGEVIGSSDASRGEGEEKLLSVPLKEGDFAVEVGSPRNKDASATDQYTLAIQ
ncbi:MAG: hypothetical protein ACXWLM_05000, partial [Myxococcales bacterium]